MPESDKGAVANIIENGLEMIVEQREPCFDPLSPNRSTGRFVHGVAGRRSECRQVFFAKAAEDCVVKKDLADRCERDRARIARGALCLGVEGSQGFERVTEKVQSVGLAGCRRENVDDAATNGELTVFAHSACPDIAVHREVFCQVILADGLTNGHRKGCAAQCRDRWHALNQRRCRRDDQERAL